MKVINGTWLLTLFVVYSHYGFAVDLEATVHSINSKNSEEYRAQVLIENKAFGCNGGSDISVGFPEYFQGDKAESAGVSIWENERLLLDIPSVIVKLDEYLSIRPFHGIIFCLDDSFLENTTVGISYRKGEFIKSILRIHSLNEFDH